MKFFTFVIFVAFIRFHMHTFTQQRHEPPHYNTTNRYNLFTDIHHYNSFHLVPNSTMHVPSHLLIILNSSRGGSRNLLWGGPNQDPQSKVEGEARIEGAKRPSIEGEARVEGAKRPRIEGEARTEGKAREKAGGGVWGGGSVSPSPENF